MGGVGNGAAEEDWHWDLNPSVVATWGLFGTWAENHGLLRHGTPDLAEGKGRTVFVGVLKDFGISMRH